MPTSASSLQPPASGLFIAGTSTEVGKTHVAVMIARSLVRAGRRVDVTLEVYLDLDAVRIHVSGIGFLVVDRVIEERVGPGGTCRAAAAERESQA